MIAVVSQFREGSLGLGELGEDLRGLFVGADPHDAVTREDFESKWSPIDDEQDLRTEPWAPAGAANDANLSVRLE